jgi:hypothetical protein
MPLQTFDFSKIEPLRDKRNPEDYSAMENFIPNVLNSYHNPLRLREEREAAARAKEAEEMKNNFLKTYGPRTEEAKIALLEAKAGNARRLARGGSGGGLGGSGGGKGNTTSSLRAWQSTPMNVRNDIIAKGAGLGYSPEEVVSAMVSGKSLKDLALQAGMKLEDAEKLYSPTTANITALKNQEGSAAELDYLEKKTKDALSPYSRKIGGYSPAQIIQAISGEDVNEQAKFLAARAIQPEIAGARSRITGGSNAQEALHDAQSAALGSSKIFESLISPEVYAKTQEYINLWLKEAFNTRKDVISNKKRSNNQEVNLEEESLALPFSTKELKRMYGGYNGSD